MVGWRVGGMVEGRQRWVEGVGGRGSEGLITVEEVGERWREWGGFDLEGGIVKGAGGGGV